MFVKLFGDRQVTVDPKIIAYLVARMERSPEEAVVLAELIDRHGAGPRHRDHPRGRGGRRWRAPASRTIRPAGDDGSGRRRR